MNRTHITTASSSKAAAKMKAAERKRAKTLRGVEFARVAPDDALIDTSVGCVLFGITSSTLYRRIAAGLIPAPIKFSERCVRWRLGDIRALLAAAAEQQ